MNTNNMDHDIIEEILVRLPVKPLAQCKSLSKHWRDFISYNKSFRQKYLFRNKGMSNSSLMLGFFFSKTRAFHMFPPEQVRFLPTSTEGRRKRDETDTLPLPLDKSLAFLGHDTLHLMGSSNGFLLCTLEHLSPRNYIICNPITKQRLSLPKPMATRTDLITHGFFFHTTYPCLDRAHSYKVVRAICLDLNGFSTTLTIELLSSDSPHQWELLNITCPFSFNLAWNIHWAIISEQGVIYLVVFLENHTRCLLIFDQRKKECVHLMEFPAMFTGTEFPAMFTGTECFGQSNGLILFGDHHLGQLKLWVLDDCTRQWSLRHRVRLELSKKVYPEFAKELSSTVYLLIAFHPTNPQVLFLSLGEKKLIYDVENSRLELISDFAEESWKMNYYLFPYTYGLIGPHLFVDG